MSESQPGSHPWASAPEDQAPPKDARCLEHVLTDIEGVCEAFRRIAARFAEVLGPVLQDVESEAPVFPDHGATTALGRRLDILFSELQRAAVDLDSIAGRVDL